MAEAAKTDGLFVRRATLADASQLASLACQLGNASTEEEVAVRLEEILRHDDHVVFVAERPAFGLAAYIEIFPLRTIAANPRIEIASFVVDESCRSQGVGRLLLEHAEEWARSHGYKETSLRCNVIRERAHLFYENLGYRVNKTQKSFRKTL